MPQLTIPADTYEKLARRAAKLNVTVEQLVTPALERIAGVEVENGHSPVPLLDNKVVFLREPAIRFGEKVVHLHRRTA